MNNQVQSYLLQGGAAELERLRLQARVWEPEAEAMLDVIGVPLGAACLDLGCGAMGILGPLSKRVGPAGRVVGVDIDDKQLDAARAYVEENGLQNIEIDKVDAYKTGLPGESFDLVHARFVFAPVGRDEELLAEMLRLTKPGGIIAIQEPEQFKSRTPRPGTAFHPPPPGIASKLRSSKLSCAGAETSTSGREHTRCCWMPG